MGRGCQPESLLPSRPRRAPWAHQSLALVVRPGDANVLPGCPISTFKRNRGHNERASALPRPEMPSRCSPRAWPIANSGVDTASGAALGVCPLGPWISSTFPCFLLPVDFRPSRHHIVQGDRRTAGQSRPRHSHIVGHPLTPHPGFAHLPDAPISAHRLAPSSSPIFDALTMTACDCTSKSGHHVFDF